MIRIYAAVLLSVFMLFGYYIYDHARIQHITETEFPEELTLNDNNYTAEVSLWRDLMPTTRKEKQTLSAAVNLVPVLSEESYPKLSLKKLYLIGENNVIIWETRLKQTSTISPEYGIEGKAYDGPSLKENTSLRAIVSFKINKGETHYLVYNDAVVEFVY